MLDTIVTACAIGVTLAAFTVALMELAATYGKRDR